MRFILCQPAITRFQWELDVCLTNLISLDYTDIVLLFGREDPEVPAYFMRKYETVEVHVYDVNWGEFQEYAPAIKPYLWTQYLSENPLAQLDDYFYMDSDVILRDRLDECVDNATRSRWFASDCGGYLNYDYIMQCKAGEEILENLSRITLISTTDIKSLNLTSGGAQWSISQPTLAYWRKVYIDTKTIWKYLQTVDSNIQKWTAEMWAQLYATKYYGIEVVTPKELDFCWATDPIERWFNTTIYHNAGATLEDNGLFFKGQYVGGRTPFDEDLSFVDPQRCSSKYVEAIKGVKMITNG